jgi:hypothetical protein
MISREVLLMEAIEWSEEEGVGDVVRSQLIYGEVITFHFVSGGSKLLPSEHFQFPVAYIFMIKIYGNLEIW